MTSRHGQRFDQDPDPAKDPDDDVGVRDHYAGEIARTNRLLMGLDPGREPELHARLTRELGQWKQLLEAETRDEHWTAGEGDRPLF